MESADIPIIYNYPGYIFIQEMDTLLVSTNYDDKMQDETFHITYI